MCTGKYLKISKPLLLITNAPIFQHHCGGAALLISEKRQLCNHHYHNALASIICYEITKMVNRDLDSNEWQWNSLQELQENLGWRCKPPFSFSLSAIHWITGNALLCNIFPHIATLCIRLMVARCNAASLPIIPGSRTGDSRWPNASSLELGWWWWWWWWETYFTFNLCFDMMLNMQKIFLTKAMVMFMKWILSCWCYGAIGAYDNGDVERLWQIGKFWPLSFPRLPSLFPTQRRTPAWWWGGRGWSWYLFLGRK